MSAPSNPRGKTTRQRRRRQESASQVMISQAMPAAPESPALDAAPRLARATEPVAPIVDQAIASMPDVAETLGRAPEVVPEAPHDVRQAFSAWLREARQTKGLSLEAMAQKTRIQVRVLTCLESAQFDALHADVFVRGYLRSYAQCVGLAVAEVLEKYTACGIAPCPVSAPDAHALGQQLVAPPPTLNVRFGTASGAAGAATASVVTPAAVSPTANVAPMNAPATSPASPAAPAAVAPIAVVEAQAASPTAQPLNGASPSGKKMPRPHLVIDDANPDLAVRPAKKSEWGDDAFTSPFLRGDREPKQGGLTLAVIVLLVAATIALSYLMKTAPSRGVTTNDAAGELVG